MPNLTPPPSSASQQPPSACLVVPPSLSPVTPCSPHRLDSKSLLDSTVSEEVDLLGCLLPAPHSPQKPNSLTSSPLFSSKSNGGDRRLKQSPSAPLIPHSFSPCPSTLSLPLSLDSRIRHGDTSQTAFWCNSRKHQAEGRAACGSHEMEMQERGHTDAVKSSTEHISFIDEE
ncbi:hypothetical protein WMY93_028486 [Mugilogobius chulae]|uniref:Uncharacterized protein n=1 Tax=Mugilogobius chulae TaxID=88201 RepID=A0AAW0MT36_9GOBI